MARTHPWKRALVTFAAIIALGLGLGLGVEIGRRLPGEADAPPPPPPAAIAVRPEGAEAEAATIAVFRARRDSVVSISTSATVRDRFTLRTGTQPLGSGSGFFWDDRGHVVTNNHVIEGASAAVVALADGRTFDARLVGRDPTHDLAVLRIEGEDLPAPLPLGESGSLEVGQGVLAIGNPFGLDWTLTRGIVSALDRDLGEGRIVIRGLIQTDAAINPGNSGGPLLDNEGQLVGVNTAIFSPSGANAGIGFAVPVGTVIRVVPQLIETGSYSPPSLGFLFDARINAAANRQGLDGVLILDAPAGAGVEPAQMTRDGRLIPGEVITAVDGEPVPTLDDLLAVIDRHAVGDSVEMTLRSGEGERQVEIVLQAGG
ncbi:S1C family serine protease [Wenxinia marina]|uniref:Serine peptidase n=1 Tax=Wenxinia marina DSM 24838 TaxID=1123501 RepID=A0A0D0Q1I7_9RHOB|nr:trypsin-like peptidase domain-containing protein [Wenxinia marina]KIQ68439.1 Serine peptidase [Wenxinia marina DSM 24838]GGL72267.1 2-alkenal reductase [Wenxinia marina]